LKEEHRLKVFENRVLKRIFGPKREEGSKENCIMVNFMVYILHIILYFFLTGFYGPDWTLAFLNGLLDPQTFGRTPWLGDQSNTRHLILLG
jgi:hypothetical protein